MKKKTALNGNKMRSATKFYFWAPFFLIYMIYLRGVCKYLIQIMFANDATYFVSTMT